MYLSMSKCKAADVSEEHRDVEYAEIDNEAETAGEKTTSNRRHSTARPLKPTPRCRNTTRQRRREAARSYASRCAESNKGHTVLGLRVHLATCIKLASRAHAPALSRYAPRSCPMWVRVTHVGGVRGQASSDTTSTNTETDGIEMGGCTNSTTCRHVTIPGIHPAPSNQSVRLVRYSSL